MQRESGGQERESGGWGRRKFRYRIFGGPSDISAHNYYNIF